jgi:hypothetical protein
MVYHRTVHDGVVVLDASAVIAEGTKVRVEPVQRSSENALVTDDQLDPLFTIGELAIDTGIPDLATNHDHYLYDHPKVTDERE